jgi:type IV pilus assembly protein PilN
MTKINLLPWREERREELRKEFFTLLAIAVGAAVLVIIIVMQAYSMAIDSQRSRNNFLNQQISLLDAQISEIKDLEKKRDQLLERMRVIQELQGNRPVIVRMFDELVRTLPEGVYYRAVKYTENNKTISLEGTAESNNRVSSLMRAFEASAWFAEPLLTSVTANPAEGENANNFMMTVKLANPNIVEEGDEQ